MPGIVPRARSGSRGARRLLVQRAGVVVTELDDHEIAGVDLGQHLVPVTLGDERAAAAAAARRVHDARRRAGRKSLAPRPSLLVGSYAEAVESLRQRALGIAPARRRALRQYSATWASKGARRGRPARVFSRILHLHGGGKWGGRWDSNPRQPGSQPGALPTELRPPLNKLSDRNGAPGRSRTRDHRLRRPVLYPTELRAHSWNGRLPYGPPGLIGWSGQQDSNLRPSAPKADALPDCAMPRSPMPPIRGIPSRARRTGRESYPSPLAGGQFIRGHSPRAAPPGRWCHGLVLENHALVRQFLADAVGFRPSLLVRASKACRDQGNPFRHRPIHAPSSGNHCQQ